MADHIHSIAVMEPFEGKEQEFLAVLRELYSVMERKNYSRDILLRNSGEPAEYVHVRQWTSAAARQEAQEDPEVHRHWAQLGHLCHMRRVLETLHEIDWKAIEGTATGPN